MNSGNTYVLALCDRSDGTVTDPDGLGHYGHVMITEPNSMFPGVSSQSTGALPSLSVPDRASTGVFLRVVQSSGGAGLHDSYYTLHSPSTVSYTHLTLPTILRV